MAENTNHTHLIIGGETWKEQLGELPQSIKVYGGLCSESTEGTDRIEPWLGSEKNRDCNFKNLF